MVYGSILTAERCTFGDGIRQPAGLGVYARRQNDATSRRHSGFSEYGVSEPCSPAGRLFGWELLGYQCFGAITFVLVAWDWGFAARSPVVVMAPNQCRDVGEAVDRRPVPFMNVHTQHGALVFRLIVQEVGRDTQIACTL